MHTFSPISFHAHTHLNVTWPELQRSSVISYSWFLETAIFLYSTWHAMSKRTKISTAYILTFSWLSSETSPVLFICLLINNWKKKTRKHLLPVRLNILQSRRKTIVNVCQHPNNHVLTSKRKKKYGKTFIFINIILIEIVGIHSIKRR